MSNIKMIATDVDGTILPYNKKLTPQLVEYVKELDEAGIKVILVTGRMHISARQIATALGLKTPIVSYQGALIRENTDEGKILYEKYVKNEYAKEIISWAKENNVRLNIYLDDELYVEVDDEVTRKYTGVHNIKAHVQPFDTLNIDKVNKILAIDYDNADRVTEWKEYLSSKYNELYVVKSTPFFCEICDKEATKGCGLKFLTDYYGFKKEEVLTIGDHNNDVELLRAGGVKIAMGNASQELKAEADYITDTVDNDGFVSGVKKFVGVLSNV